MKKECCVAIYKEGFIGSFLFGQSKANSNKMGRFLTGYTTEGWEVKTMSIEKRRMLLFWSREAYVFILERAL